MSHTYLPRWDLYDLLYLFYTISVLHVIRHDSPWWLPIFVASDQVPMHTLPIFTTHNHVELKESISISMRVLALGSASTDGPSTASTGSMMNSTEQVIMVPLLLRAGTAVYVLLCLISSIETFIVACFVTTGKISENEL